MIPVTKTFLPPIEEYTDLLKKVWEDNWITNQGPFVKQLEKQLREYLGVENVHFVANGTLALQISLKALGIVGEVITTPFSFVATTSCLVWEGCTPVFVDIESSTLNIDPNKIESAITKDTTAILATHVYGNPCDIAAIEKIAKKNNLLVLYDAAHCFGTTYNHKSVFNYGDISIVSFHATKLFHTVEGGAIFSRNKTLHNKAELYSRFGIRGPEEVVDIGVNAKNSEFHAVMGIVNLNHIESILKSRKHQYMLYLDKLDKLKITTLLIQKNSVFNYAYMPIRFDSEEMCLAVKRELEKNSIYPRRYFYPSLNNLPYISQPNLPISSHASRVVLCLPMYFGLKDSEILKVCTIIKNVLL